MLRTAGTNPRSNSRKSGFTLIELLVVITIIVLLLSLLAPALDRAIERAELIQCAANARAIVQAVQMYSAANKRFYPDRGTTTGHISDLTLNYGASGDLRPAVREFIPLKQFNDPFVIPVDFDPEKTQTSARVVASYNILWGVNWGYGSISKVGQKLGWDPSKSPATNDPNAGQTFKFDILLADMDHVYNDAQFWSSHPGSNGTLANNPRQNDRGGDGLYTSSFWLGGGDPGVQNYNYVYQDGSVRLVDNASWVDGDGDPSTVDWVVTRDSDERFIQTPRDTKSASNYPGRRSKLPKN